MATKIDPLHPENTTTPDNQVSPPKRKVGRPPKTDKSSTVPLKKRGVKSEAARNSRLAARKVGASTRELIIGSACEIINRTGVVDFRIETLAQSLALSPGNITYHFPKKEDIVNAIWLEFSAQFGDNPEEVLTPLLDIKQLFLFLRTRSAKTIPYVGVATYYFGDMGALMRNHDLFNSEYKLLRKLMYDCYDTLCANGYMNPIENITTKELTFQTQFVMLCWWSNHALTKYSREDLPSRMDRYIAMSLIPLTPYLTPLGKQQLDSIVNFIK